MVQTWLDKPRSNWWTKEAVGSVVQANISKGGPDDVDGVTQMMVAAYKQWADIETLLSIAPEAPSGETIKKMEEIKTRHEKYRAKIQQAVEWRAGMMAEKVE